MMDKRQFLETVIIAIRELDIVQIIGQHVQLVRRGPHAHGLCPFHSDHSIGSFVVTSSKGMYKCFACGEGGDAISFVANILNVNYIEAAFTIALNERIISQDEYEENFKRRRYTKDEAKNAEKVFTAPTKDYKKKLPSGRVLDAFYQVFLKNMCPGKDGELRLEEQDLEYLRNERGLSDELILERGYCSLLKPTDARLNKFIEELVEKGLSEEGLLTIPGFFQKLRKRTDENGEKIEEWVTTFAYSEGVILPMKNAMGQIIALQVRRREKDEFKGRYVWFSSGFANYNNKLRNGTSPGSPIDVLFPKGMPTQALFITEGRFKSEVIADRMRSVAISVQGVGNWKGILEDIEAISEITSSAHPSFKGFKYLYVAFDSDMRFKYQVYSQLKKMTDAIQEKLPELKIVYLYWDTPEKGIDDLLHAKDENGNFIYDTKEVIQKFDKELWDKQYEEQVAALTKEYSVTSPLDLHPELLKKSIHIKKEKD